MLAKLKLGLTLQFPLCCCLTCVAAPYLPAPVVAHQANGVLESPDVAAVLIEASADGTVDQVAVLAAVNKSSQELAAIKGLLAVLQDRIDKKVGQGEGQGGGGGDGCLHALPDVDHVSGSP